MQKTFLILVSFVFITLLSYLSPTLVHAATCSINEIRFASTSNTIYVTGPVDCTLSDIKTIRPSVPLDLIDASRKIWLLKANLRLEQGARLNLHGDSIGGDVNVLRLKSNNSTAANSIIFIRAYWGTIDIVNSQIISWNESGSGPDTEYAKYGRSYIHARSFLDTDGVTPRESRMDIVNSDVGYLGYYAAESYGLSWKVLGPSPSVFETVNVYGDITNSRIHHNYFGVYTYGAYGMQILNNEIYNNVQYGLDPHDDSDSLLIEGNNSHDNGNHGIICSQRCDHLVIRNNISKNNKGNGIMLHRNTNDTLVENNQFLENGDAGIAIFDSHNNTIRNNISLRNNHGIRLSVGSSNNTIEQNDLGANNLHGIYFYKGSDPPTSGDGRPKNNRFIGNTIHDNRDYVIKLKEGDGNIFENNTLSGNFRELYIYDAKNNIFLKNVFTGSNNFYHARYISDNTIIDTTPIKAKVGDNASRLVIKDTSNYVIQNDKSIATIAEPLQTSIVFTRNVSSSTVNFSRLNLKIVPNASQIVVKILNWPTSSTSAKTWSETSSNSSDTSNHVVSDLEASRAYDVVINSVLWNTYTADSNGVISFLYDGGYSNQKTFEVKPSTSSSASITVLNDPTLTITPTITPTESMEATTSSQLQ